MNLWKRMPYWLKGGILAGGITGVFFFLFYLCTISDTAPGSFICLPFIVLSPILPFAILFDKLNPLFEYNLPFITLPIVSIFVWFLIGSIIGVIIKKRRSE